MPKHLSLDIHEHRRVTFEKINEKDIDFPLNRMLLFVKLTKEIATHNYYTEPELTGKLTQIVKILDELKKDV